MTHGLWKGDSVGYSAIHWRLRERRGKASDLPCVGCGSPAVDWAYDNSDPAEKRCAAGAYSTDLDRYQPMCRSCHRLMDSTHGGRALCGTDAGYYRHRRTGTQTCDTCRTAHNIATRRRAERARTSTTREIQ